MCCYSTHLHVDSIEHEIDSAQNWKKLHNYLQERTRVYLTCLLQHFQDQRIGAFGISSLDLTRFQETQGMSNKRFAKVRSIRE